jgi:hypothetical protein
MGEESYLTFQQLKDIILDKVNNNPGDCYIARRALQLAETFLLRSPEKPLDAFDVVISTSSEIKRRHAAHCPQAARPSHFCY